MWERERETERQTETETETNRTPHVILVCNCARFVHYVENRVLIGTGGCCLDRYHMWESKSLYLNYNATFNSKHLASRSWRGETPGCACALDCQPMHSASCRRRAFSVRIVDLLTFMSQKCRKQVAGLLMVYCHWWNEAFQRNYSQYVFCLWEKKSYYLTRVTLNYALRQTDYITI